MSGSRYGIGLYGAGPYSAWAPLDLMGDLAPVVVIGPSALWLNNQVDFQANLSVAVSVQGYAGVAFAFSNAAISPTVVLAANLTAGSLWGPAPTCDPVVWEEMEACA